jgi:lipopolysaccharide/colanic/teichoic acid biosynthesis glycosyltransferase
VTRTTQSDAPCGVNLSAEPFNGSTVGSPYVALKTAFDFSFSLLIAAFCWPLLLAAMAAVKLTSRGPVIYRQVRLGLDGRRFTIFKIRTMYHDCERTTGPRWSTDNDPRITAVGRLLRRTHLDELPQLWNVLRGDMSLVGPRPERPEFVERLERAIPDYRGRLSVRPGLTGLAQVQLPPDSDMGGVRLKVRCDLCYVRLMGPWLDFRILVGTGLKILGVPFETTRRLLRLPGVETPADVRTDVRSEEHSGQWQTA